MALMLDDYIVHLPTRICDYTTTTCYDTHYSLFHTRPAGDDDNALSNS